MDRYKDFCIEWNNVIPYKIKESELAMPNEGILTNALLHYLEQFGFSVKLLKENQQSEHMDVRHKFKIDLCTYINYIYKLGNETSQPFTYFDLIRPTPKKTHHILKYLLNYLLFFNMMKLDVIEPTKEKIQEYNEIMQKIKYDKTTLEENQIAETDIEVQINKNHKECSKAENLISKERDLNKELQRLKFTIEELDSSLATFRKQEIRLQSDVVTNDEAETLLNKKLAVEREFQEQTEVQQATMEGNRERKIAINKLNEFIKHAENAMEVYSLENFNKLCSVQKSRIDLEQSIKVFKQKNEQAKAIIQEKIKECIAMKTNIKDKNVLLKNISKENEQHINELEKSIEREEQNIDQIDTKLHDVEDQLIDEEENESTIKVAKYTLLKHLKEKDPCYINE